MSNPLTKSSFTSDLTSQIQKAPRLIYNQSSFIIITLRIGSCAPKRVYVKTYGLGLKSNNIKSVSFSLAVMIWLIQSSNKISFKISIKPLQTQSSNFAPNTSSPRINTYNHQLMSINLNAPSSNNQQYTNNNSNLNVNNTMTVR